jgi:hypothetical protein
MDGEMEPDLRQRFRDDAATLARIGVALSAADLPRVEVRIPTELADAAVAAWQHDDEDGDLGPETVEQRQSRHRAAALALIGLSIETSSRVENDHIVVELNAGLIGSAIDAADDLADSEPPR